MIFILNETAHMATKLGKFRHKFLTIDLCNLVVDMIAELAVLNATFNFRLQPLDCKDLIVENLWLILSQGNPTAYGFSYISSPKLIPLVSGLPPAHLLLLSTLTIIHY